MSEQKCPQQAHEKYIDVISQNSLLDIALILATCIPVERAKIQVAMNQECDAADIPNEQRPPGKTRLLKQERHEQDDHKLPDYPLRCLGNNMSQLARTNIHCIFPWNWNYWGVQYYQECMAVIRHPAMAHTLTSQSGFVHLFRPICYFRATASGNWLDVRPWAAFDRFVAE
ncbi:MAG: hypothetical protein KKH12_09845 [Gammaproteobacteria bacterium]|nr:hypothetical protein [Gammaproteobacteria bacterium]MBU1481964.1 hypothetical protein [Gammaproteobacteria bacterium]